MSDSIIRQNDHIILPTIFYDWIEPDTTCLRIVVAFLKKHPGLKVDFAVYTDSRGSEKYNKELSQMRADACVRYLVTKGGIDPGRVEAHGYGEFWPLVSDEEIARAKTKQEKEALHARNRRAELIISPF